MAPSSLSKYDSQNVSEARKVGIQVTAAPVYEAATKYLDWPMHWHG